MFATVTNSVTFVSDASAEEELLLTQLLTYTKKLTVKSTSDRIATPDVLVSAYEDNKFLTGFLPVVVAAFRKRGLSVTIQDLRSGGTAKPYDFDSLPFDLRPYQKEALLSFFRHKRGIVQMPMGSGKTEVGIAACMLLPIRWVYLVPGVELLEEVKLRFARHMKDDVGRVGKGERLVKRVTVCTLESAIKEYGSSNLLSRAEGIIIDEGQKIASEARIDVLGKHCNAYWRLCLSYTPFARADGRELFVVGAAGPRIYTVGENTLQRDGFVANGEVVAVAYDSEPLDEESIITYRDAYEQGIVWNSTRNELVCDIVDSEAKPLVVFAKEHTHISILVDMLQKRGWRVDFVHQDVPGAKRKEISSKLASGDLDVVVASGVWERGVNIPELRCGINAAGGMAEEPTRQRRGRIMRTAPNKRWWRFFEFIDTHQRWLMRHSYKRIARHRNDGILVTYDDRRSDQTEPLLEDFADLHGGDDDLPCEDGGDVVHSQGAERARPRSKAPPEHSPL